MEVGLETMMVEYSLVMFCGDNDGIYKFASCVGGDIKAHTQATRI